MMFLGSFSREGTFHLVGESDEVQETTSAERITPSFLHIKPTR